MASASFAAALAFTLQAEGGWSDDPADPGGATMKGITLATFRQHYPGSTVDDLRDISDDQVADIYRTGYWNAVKGDDLPAGVDLSVFDMAVNAGPGRSIRLLQGVVGADPDGVIGPETMGAVAAQDHGSTIERLRDAQQQYYGSLPTFDRFGAGWTNRTNARRDAALALIGQTEA